MKIAIFSLTKDRVQYTEKFLSDLNDKTNLPFDHYILDQGSSDGTVELLKNFPQKNGQRFIYPLNKNIGINRGVNFLVDKIGNQADIIIKFDNDMEIETDNWLLNCVNVLQPKLIISPYIKGLIENRAGVNRIGLLPGIIGQTPFIGGMCMIGLRQAWSIGWTVPSTLHPNGGDLDFCQRLSLEGYIFGYKEDVIIRHQETSSGQKEKYKEYFELRKIEKVTKL
jgi:GT2 family glycosyltransferase